MVDLGLLGKFVRRTYGATESGLVLETTPLRAGLVSEGVFWVRARFAAADRSQRTVSFVVKTLSGGNTREARVHAHLADELRPAFVPRLLGVQATSGRTLLYLEAVRAARRWPWPDNRLAHRVLENVAHLHERADPRAFSAAVAPWDYEAELTDAARLTLEVPTTATRHSVLAPLRSSVRHLGRLVEELPQIRQTVTGDGTFGATVLHGDLHTANVVARRRRTALEPVLLGWGRARVGSCLEDVASWLQSLGFWDLEAKRRHDTLLRAYLRARGLSGHVGGAVRDLYWLSAASNLLGGALLYHLETAAHERLGSRQRARAYAAARDALRVARQAESRWRGVRLAC